MTLLGHLARLGGADFIQGLIHLGDDVEAIEDVQRLGAFLADHVQVGLPHIGADRLALGSQLLSDDGEESLEGFEGAFLANPEQAGESLVDLVDQRQVFVAFGTLDFIYPNGADRLQRAMLQARCQAKVPNRHRQQGFRTVLPGSPDAKRQTWHVRLWSHFPEAEQTTYPGAAASNRCSRA